ncbi:MBL fold metallo-hydrolase [Candidatus Bathyarchaeota archaeon]|nr:MBL fold metallo-hydrolase [Candidatus Bathyarchaeota archaeon]
MKSVDSVKITTVVDNDVWTKGLSSSWGLSFYVETFKENKKQHTILMDVSGSFPTFHENAEKMNLDLTTVEAVFISHWHGDHCGALSQVLPLIKHTVPVYVPSADNFGMREIENAGGKPVVCLQPTEFMEGLMSTGEIPINISEHSLIINVKEKGLVVLVGCSHPGITTILKRAKQVSSIDKVYGVMGGFHISGINNGLKIGEFLKELNVELASPCHCTGYDARKGITQVIGEKYVKNGSGKIITV